MGGQNSRMPTRETTKRHQTRTLEPKVEPDETMLTSSLLQFAGIYGCRENSLFGRNAGGLPVRMTLHLANNSGNHLGLGSMGFRRNAMNSRDRGSVLARFPPSSSITIHSGSVRNVSGKAEKKSGSIITRFAP